MKTVFLICEFDEHSYRSENVGWFDNEPAANAYALTRSREDHAESVKASEGGKRYTVLPFDELNSEYWKFTVHPLHKLD